MPIQSGTKLGPYEIVAVIGAGGMGEVYRAKDTRLDRTVAIKVLPSHLSANPDLRQRLEREARAVSSLNHPYICTLHDIGHQDGIDFLVMEHIEGETLSDRLKKGALPPEQVLRYGMQIADALDKAHRQGVVHRDLKPGNIMLTKSGVKLLDFGLAKVSGQEGVLQQNTVSQLATEQRDLTKEGTILGTIQYMAPEQLEGRATDGRTDIFALGSVLYEMITGKRAFEGKSQASLISAILKDEPAPISNVQPLAPPALDHIVKKCLAKDPEERWQSAYDVASELKWISEGSSAATIPISVGRARKNREWLWIVVSALSLAIAAFAILRPRESKAPAELVRFSISPPKDSFFQGSIAISPDGKKIAFVAADSELKNFIWVRAIDSIEAQRLPDTDGALFPFWSYDSRNIAYFAHGKLKKIDTSGGVSQVISNAPDARGGSWNKDGVILFAPSSQSPLYQVSAEGGASVQVTADISTTSQRFPVFLPDGRHFLFVVTAGGRNVVGIHSGSLDSKNTKQLLPVVSKIAYVSPGYLLYIDQGNLMCRPFDANRMDFRGNPVLIASQPWMDYFYFGSSAFTVSDNGVLAYRSGGLQLGVLTWFDRTGKKLRTVGPSVSAQEPYFSPDQKRVAFYQASSVPGINDVWTLDLSTGNISRFTFDPSDDGVPVWSPDGSRLVWNSSRNGPYDLFQKAADGAGAEEPLLKNSSTKNPDDWSRDGKYILYEQQDSPNNYDLWILPVTGDQKPVPFVQSSANEWHGRFSPDGKWIAYSSNESGEYEIYVHSFPSTKSGKWQISIGGGDQPIWRQDGKELFFVGEDGTIMAAEVKNGQPGFSAETPKPLFKLANPNAISGSRNDYLVSADGQEFLMNVPLQQIASSPITVVVNWPALLKK